MTGFGMGSQHHHDGETQEQVILRIMRGSRTPVRVNDLLEAGASRTAISRLAAAGEIAPCGRGVYRMADAEFDAHESWAALARRAPSSVICLTSAASFHGMTQDGAWRVTAAVPHSLGTTPSLGTGVETDIVRWRSRAAFEVGVDEHEVIGVPVRITNPSRTLVDMFRMSTLNRGCRSTAARITPETFMDALYRYLDPDRGLEDVSELARIAGTFEVIDDMFPLVQTAQYGVTNFRGP